VSELWAHLGYDEIAERLGSALQRGTDICVIEGPPGVGKSWLAKDIGSVWEERGGSTVLAEGDSLKGDAFFYPLGIAMGGLPSGWRAVGPALAGVTRAAEALVGTAGLLTATIEAIIAARGMREQRRKPFMGEAEQAVLQELERLSGEEHPILFIADNLHWWDADSIAFLGRLRDERMAEAFPFLEGIRLLAVQTPEPHQSPNNPVANEALLADSAEIFALPRIPLEGFEDVLVDLGSGIRPSEEVTEIIHRFSGGHLALASRCAERIQKGESEAFLTASDAEEFLRRLVTDRIRSLGDAGKDALDLLQVAAVLGLAFRREEIACAAESTDVETARLLHYCRSEGVLEAIEGLDRFVHDLYRQHFLELSEEEKVAIHHKLCLCLRQLRPSSYELRCVNALDAEQPNEAATLAIQAALQKERQGRNLAELPDRVTELLRQDAWQVKLERFRSARQHLDGARFDECLKELDGLPRDLPKPLLAEADLLRAMCLMSTRSEDDRASGRAVLAAWDGYEEEEFEVGIRLLQLRLYGFSKLFDKEKGRELEIRVRQKLGERAGFDESAKDAGYILDRCSSGLYPPEIAIIRKREAAAYFAPREGQTLPRHPLEYYRSLNNYCASLLSNAHYAQAHEECGRLERLIDEYTSGTFTRLDFPYMNELLARYRLQLVTAQEAAARQNEIVALADFAGDPFYAMNALGVYHVLAGEFEAALPIFDEQLTQLTRHRSSPEASMLYLISANRCAADYLAGNVDEALVEWRRVGEIATEITYMFRPLLIRRHELLARVMEDFRGTGMSPLEFDACLLDRGGSEFGRHWQSFGRGFRLPEVEFWREN
jgi:AAA ATPase domain